MNFMADNTGIMEPNGVKMFKSMRINSSPGKVRHVQQLSRDRHPANARTNSIKMIKFLETYLSPINDPHERQASPDRYPVHQTKNNCRVMESSDVEQLRPVRKCKTGDE